MGWFLDWPLLRRRPLPQYSSAFHPVGNIFKVSSQLSKDIVDDARNGAGRVDNDPGG